MWSPFFSFDITWQTDDLFIPQDKDNSIKDEENIQESKNEIELVDDKPKTIAKEAQRKLNEKTR